MKVEERFLKYVSYWTTSCDGQEQIPSTNRQFELGRALAEELRELGLSQVKCDEHCYVYGLLPATEGYEHKKAVGLIAHMDTAPDFSGRDVHPVIIPDYDGGDVTLQATGDVLRVSDFPRLSSRRGQTLIVTDGTTLLGADDKAGAAEIITAVEQIVREQIPHGDIWVGITPDEEVGRGFEAFDLEHFKADYAYTVDGDYEGEISYENFNAAAAVFQFKGVNVHPGSAKDIMVNAGSIACELHRALPTEEVPEHTEDRQGFYHLTDMQGEVAHAKLQYIVRDHDQEAFEKRLAFLRDLEASFNETYGQGTVTLTITQSYRNMLEVVKEHFYIIEKARAAMKAVGITPESPAIRGGTDGAELSFRGLPCPNLGTGGEGFHGPMEHITVEAMEQVVKVLIEIAKNPAD